MRPTVMGRLAWGTATCPNLSFPRDDDIVDDNDHNYNKDNNDGEDNCIDDLDGDNNA